MSAISFPILLTSATLPDVESCPAFLYLFLLGSGTCTDQLDLAFVIDSSGSINEDDLDNWSRVLSFVRQVAAAYPIGPNDTRVAAVRYSNLANVEFDLQTYNSPVSVDVAIEAMKYIGGTTNTADGLEALIEDIFKPEAGDRPNVTDLAIVITDGFSNERVREVPLLARTIRDSGVRIVVVGITLAVNEAELMTIASSPEDILEVFNFTLLAQSVDPLLKMICPSDPPSPTTSPIPVSFTSPGRSAQCQKFLIKLYVLG